MNNNVINLFSKKEKKPGITTEEAYQDTRCVWECVNCIEERLQKIVDDAPEEQIEVELPDGTFIILEDGYECSHCQHFFTFDDVHGAL